MMQCEMHQMHTYFIPPSHHAPQETFLDKNEQIVLKAVVFRTDCCLKAVVLISIQPYNESHQ